MLKNKLAIVTGGTKGIGFEIVKKYLENGARVVLFGSRAESVDRALEELEKINKDWPVEGRYPDLSDPAAIRETIEEIGRKYGNIDILVNNAGRSDSKSVFDYEDDYFESIMSLNVNAIINTIRASLPFMKEKGGSIINTSSMVSLQGQPSGVAYPTSKFAVNGLTISLARELGRYNIRVNAVAPGITNTDMVKNLPKEMIEPLIKMIPLGRVGEPEDVANAFLFLASDMASYVNGAVLRVDGAMRV